MPTCLKTADVELCRTATYNTTMRGTLCVCCDLQLKQPNAMGLLLQLLGYVQLPFNQVGQPHIIRRSLARTFTERQAELLAELLILQLAELLVLLLAEPLAELLAELLVLLLVELLAELLVLLLVELLAELLAC